MTQCCLVIGNYFILTRTLRYVLLQEIWKSESLCASLCMHRQRNGVMIATGPAAVTAVNSKMHLYFTGVEMCILQSMKYNRWKTLHTGCYPSTDNLDWVENFWK